MKSNKALRFLVLLLAVVAFFINVSCDSGGGNQNNNNTFRGTFVHEFQTTGRVKLKIYDDGKVEAFESMDSGENWDPLGSTTYKLSDNKKRINLDKPLDGISYLEIISNSFLKAYGDYVDGWGFDWQPY